MTRLKSVRVIHPTFRSGRGGEGRIEFIRCVDGQEPQFHKLWTFAEDEITREVHPFARVDVGDFSGDCFQTYYMTEESCGVTIFGRVFINVSAEWLGVPATSCGTGVSWTENILVPNSRWGDVCFYERWALATHSRPRFGGRSVPWRGMAPFCPNYVPSSPENARARAHRVCDVRLQERCLARAQALLSNLHFDDVVWGNGSDDSLDGWVDK